MREDHHSPLESLQSLQEILELLFILGHFPFSKELVESAINQNIVPRRILKQINANATHSKELTDLHTFLHWELVNYYCFIFHFQVHFLLRMDYFQNTRKISIVKDSQLSHLIKNLLPHSAKIVQNSKKKPTSDSFLTLRQKFHSECQTLLLATLSFLALPYNFLATICLEYFIKYIRSELLNRFFYIFNKTHRLKKVRTSKSLSLLLVLISL